MNNKLNVRENENYNEGSDIRQKLTEESKTNTTFMLLDQMCYFIEAHPKIFTGLEKKVLNFKEIVMKICYIQAEIT